MHRTALPTRMTALAAVALVLGVGFAGCFDAFTRDGATPYTPRTVEITLIVHQSMSDSVPIYTLNDGQREMRVVAMPFMLPDQQVPEVPGPEIRVKEGDTVRLTVINQNPLSHTLHLHGGLIPWAMDGVPYMTQEPIHPGQEFTYVFEDLKAGTYFYHCHVDEAHHMDLGMYGAFIVEEVEPEYEFDREYVLMLDSVDTCHVHGNLDPITGGETHGTIRESAECVGRFIQDNLGQNMIGDIPRSALCDIPGLPQEVYDELDCDAHMTPPPQQEPRTWWPETHPVYAPVYNAFLINGKAFPDTQVIVVEEGETVKLRLINVAQTMHSMHIHGHKMLVTHRDGYPLQSPFYVDTLGIFPGERYDVVFEADNPGFWMFHDHFGLHMMNDHHDPGGMMTCIAYDGFHGYDATQFENALDCVHAAREIFQNGHGHQGHAGHGAAADPRSG